MYNIYLRCATVSELESERVIKTTRYNAAYPAIDLFTIIEWCRSLTTLVSVCRASNRSADERQLLKPYGRPPASTLSVRSRSTTTHQIDAVATPCGRSTQRYAPPSATGMEGRLSLIFGHRSSAYLDDVTLPGIGVKIYDAVRTVIAMFYNLCTGANQSTTWLSISLYI